MRSNERADLFDDIIENIGRIERHVSVLGASDLNTNELVADAVERCLARISEAAVRLGDDAIEFVPGHPWNHIRGLGNRLRHAYDRIDTAVIREIVDNQLPKLKTDIEASLRKERFSSGDG